MATPTRLTLDQFLALPPSKPYQEFVRGELVAKAMPNQLHSRLVARLIRLVGAALESRGESDPDTELRHVARGEARVYLPDISVTTRDRRAPIGQDPVEVPPDLVVEVLSPDDRAGDVLEKADFYMRIGVRLLWLVDPATRTVTIYCPGRQPGVLRSPAALDADPVIPGFHVALEDLFAILDDAPSPA